MIKVYVILNGLKRLSSLKDKIILSTKSHWEDSDPKCIFQALLYLFSFGHRLRVSIVSLSNKTAHTVHSVKLINTRFPVYVFYIYLDLKL